MLALIPQPQVTIESFIYEILASGRITRSERRHLRAAILNDSLSEAEHTVINRLLYGVKHGLVNKVN
jgi:hypothetical protein